jgi:hypothetical protein
MRPQRYSRSHRGHRKDAPRRAPAGSCGALLEQAKLSNEDRTVGYAHHAPNKQRLDLQKDLAAGEI